MQAALCFVISGWSVYETKNGAVFSPDVHSRFKAVVFSNACGDMLADDQRVALQSWIEATGGFVGILAAGDDSHAGRQYRDLGHAQRAL